MKGELKAVPPSTSSLKMWLEGTSRNFQLRAELANTNTCAHPLTTNKIKPPTKTTALPMLLQILPPLGQNSKVQKVNAGSGKCLGWSWLPKANLSIPCNSTVRNWGSFFPAFFSGAPSENTNIFLKTKLMNRARKKTIGDEIIKNCYQVM